MRWMVFFFDKVCFRPKLFHVPLLPFLLFAILLNGKMTKTCKVIESIRNNPKAVRFEDACKVAETIGFIYSAGKGSHQVFKRPHELTQLNFQNRNGYIPHYQAKQLLTIIAKYEEEP